MTLLGAGMTSPGPLLMQCLLYNVQYLCECVCVCDCAPAANVHLNFSFVT